MQFSVTLRVLLAGLFLFTTVHANFHIWSRTQRCSCLAEDCEDIVEDDLVLCPFNKANCDCWGKGKSAARIADWDELYLPPNHFRTSKGVCGVGIMDFYNRGGGKWEFYFSGGNGEKQGTCWEDSDKTVKQCDTAPLCSATVKKSLWCQTYICE
jgi:hypothetical protein